MSMAGKYARAELGINSSDLRYEYTGDKYLKNGIWPRSASLWMAAFYVALFIIRPWEILLPWLSVIRFERLYALTMIAVMIASHKKEFVFKTQSGAVLLFFFSLCLSTAVAFDSQRALDVLYMYVTLLIFYFVLLSIIRTPYDLYFISVCYILAMFVYLSKAQWEFFVNDAAIYDMGVHRMVGLETTFGSPNSLAMSIVVSLPIWLFLWISRKEISSSWPAQWKKWFPRFLSGYFILALTSVLLTNSRSGMLSFVLFVMLASTRKKGIFRKVAYVFAGALFLLTLWQVMPQDKRDRLSTIWNPQAGPATAEVSAQGRIEGYRAGVAMFKRHPVAGVGLGNFIPYRVRYVDGVHLSAHNLAGQVLGETGFVGAFAFVVMVAAILLNIRKTRGRAKTKPDPEIATLANLAHSCRDCILLLAFEGLFGHNLLRFNWLWLAAFCVHASRFTDFRAKAILNIRFDGMG